MFAGVDVGYDSTKICGDSGKRFSFKSVVGSPDKSSFGLNGSENLIMLKPCNVALGQGAVVNSQYLNRHEDRAWFRSEDYMSLFYGALTHLTNATSAQVDTVTNLPIRYFSDAQELKDTLTGEHVFQFDGKPTQRITVKNVRVIPQGTASLLSIVLDGTGKIVDNSLAIGRVGLLDIGSHTVNLSLVEKLSQVDKLSDSIEAGGWTLVKSIGKWIAETYDGLSALSDHDIMQAIVSKELKYYGKPIPEFVDVVNEHVDRLADQVLAKAEALWSIATLDAVLVCGGGAMLIGDAIKAKWPHAEVVASPRFSNSIGCYRLARRLFS